MRLLIELAHWRLLVDLSPACDEYEGEEEEDGHARLGVDTAFGFAPDPVFPDLDWGESEERRGRAVESHPRRV